MSKQPKPKLQDGEKILLAVSLLAVVLLVGVGMNRAAKPHYAAAMAQPETACKSLIKAMLNQDETQVQHLTTSHGYAGLHGYIKSKQFNSYPQLAHRMMAEWGNTAFWEDATMPESQASWGLTTAVKPNERIPDITFKRTSEGWKLDNYVPQPNRLVNRRKHFGQMWNLK